MLIFTIIDLILMIRTGMFYSQSQKISIAVSINSLCLDIWRLAHLLMYNCSYTYLTTSWRSDHSCCACDCGLHFRKWQTFVLVIWMFVTVWADASVLYVYLDPRHRSVHYYNPGGR